MLNKKIEREREKKTILVKTIFENTTKMFIHILNCLLDKS